MRVRIMERNGKNLGNKIKSMEQCKNTDEEDKFIVKEKLNDMGKHFTNDDDHYANQHSIGCEDSFRGLTVKDWAIDDHDSANLHPHNKI